jgi:hypothetical protein
MFNSRPKEHYVQSNYSKSLSDLHLGDISRAELKELCPRKSFFDPQQGLA